MDAKTQDAAGETEDMITAVADVAWQTERVKLRRWTVRTMLATAAGFDGDMEGRLHLALDNFANRIQHDEGCESWGRDGIGDPLACNCGAEESFREIVKVAEFAAAAPRETAFAAPTGETEEEAREREFVEAVKAEVDETRRVYRYLLDRYPGIKDAPVEFVVQETLRAAARVPAPSAPQEPRGEPSEAMVLREYDRKLVEVWGKEEHPHAVAYGWVKSQWDAVLAATRHTQGEG